jgi:myo-inositol 2-dehydrogenase/D-chiro-inositol 1-dehydrogenase
VTATSNRGPAFAARPPVRTAILGLGRMGRTHLECAIDSTDALEIVAVADVAPGRAVDVVHQLGLSARAYDSIERCLDETALDACLVVTPTHTHESLVRAVLVRELHVLCEKPLTLDPAIDEALGDQAARAGVVLQVGFWRRYSPPWVAAARAWRAGSIGSLELYRGALWDAQLPPPQFHDVGSSGGLIVDCGVHDFDCLAWLLDDEVVAVEAFALPFAEASVESTGDLDNAAILLRMRSGAVAFVDLSRTARFADDMRMEILGSRGALFVDTFPTARARIGDAAGMRTLAGSEVADAFIAGIVGEQRAFARAIWDGEPVPGSAESARALRVALQARLRAEEGRRAPAGSPDVDVAPAQGGHAL